MTPEERAEKVSATLRLHNGDIPKKYAEVIERYFGQAIREAVAEEREACAKLADNAQLEDEGHWQAREIAERLAAAIRKRGEQPADVI